MLSNTQNLVTKTREKICKHQIQVGQTGGSRKSKKYIYIDRLECGTI